MDPLVLTPDGFRRRERRHVKARMRNLTTVSPSIAVDCNPARSDPSLKQAQPVLYCAL
jgi:hypothetical protein